MEHLPSKEVVVALTTAKEHLVRKRKVPSNFIAGERWTVDKTTNEVAPFPENESKYRDQCHVSGIR